MYTNINQNILTEDFLNKIHNVNFAVTIKEFSLSFNIMLKEDETKLFLDDVELDINDQTSNQVKLFKKYNFESILNKNIIIETDCKESELQIRDVFNLNDKRYLNYDELCQFCRDNNLPKVKTVTDVFVFDKVKHTNEYLLNMVKKVSNDNTESLVYTSIFENKFNNQRLKFQIFKD